jgi:cytochrome c oxidase subunit IV
MAQAAHAMGEHDHPNYMAIFWILLVLTIAELATAMIPTGGAYPYPLKVALLVGMALGKAALVAAYFMHLRFERSTLSLIAVTPLLLCVFLLFMLFPDRLDRTHLHSPITPPAAAPAHH